MSNRTVGVDQRVVSSVGAIVNGQPIYVGGNLYSVQVDSPAALGGTDISLDKLTWTADLATLADNSINTVTKRVNWVRPTTAIDAGGPRNFDFRVLVYKEAGR